MKCLVLGAGGREHALAWKLSKSPSCSKVVLHPGNAGTLATGIENLGAGVQDDLQSLLHIAKVENFELVVIGPEVYLAKGYADKFREDGLLVVGPNQLAAQLETSKVFAKEFMKRAGIPTAAFTVASNEADLREQVQGKLPIVLKLDGLAAGKGVVVATQSSDIDDFCHRVWKQKEFGNGPHKVVIEECLTGRELSYIGLCDGHRFLAFTSSSDYKRVGDGHTGPNTGGMGVVSPSPVFTEDLEEKIQNRIIAPMLAQLKKDHLFYRGALYVGVMVNEAGDPFVLEFNTRFGDPETQAILPRLRSDFCDLLTKTAKGELNQVKHVDWMNDTFVYVVGAAENYPGTPKIGDPISGWKEWNSESALLFFSGVKNREGELLTNGGRVLGVGSWGGTVHAAREHAYQALKKITWRGLHFRKDIGL